jgi:hypothetical protein
MTLGNMKIASLTALAAGSLLYAAPAGADPASAKQIVKAMSDYIASQNNLSGDFDVALDVTTPQLEKITFDASGTLLISRPGKIRATRKGGYADMELVSDGTTTTVIDRVSGAYSQAKSPATLDGLIEMLRGTYGLDMPAGDLLMTNSYDRLMEGVVEAKHIGIGVIDGYDCEHLAFRNADTDWQLWVRTGDRPLPCKYVILSKKVVGYPTYTIQFRNWSSGRAAAADAFGFTPAKGARKVTFDQMSTIGELPPPAATPSGGR